MKSICRERFVYIPSHAIEARKNPAVFKRNRFKPGNSRVGTAALGCPDGTKSRLSSVHTHEHEPRRIPYLVSERPIPFRPALVERNIRSRRGHRRQREARRVCPEALNNV